MSDNLHAPIRRAAVLGAGVMGAQIAAHLVNAGVETLLFDLPAKEGAKNGIVTKAIEQLKKANPAPLAHPSRAAYIRAANYDEHLPLLAECDLVIEAIAERIDWKAGLFARVTPYLGANAILASNTSGLSINALAEQCPAELRSRFCGIHFFNPPRYMHLVELIAATDTDAGLLDRLEAFLVTTLGKGVVRAKDTPNFIANRIGVFSMLATLHHAKQFGLRFDVVDDLTGDKLGRAKSATFRTADVVGLDIFSHVVGTMRDGLPEDPWHRYFAAPDWLAGLIAQGQLGQKSGGGIYRKEGKQLLVFDPATGQHIPSGEKAGDAIELVLKNKKPAKRLQLLRNSSLPEAQFLWACFRDVFHYIAVHLAEIADSARDVDFAIRWGFGWKQGPFELWQLAGWQQVAAWVAEDIAAGRAMSNTPLPNWVLQPDRSGVHSSEGSYSPVQDQDVPRSSLPVYWRQLVPAMLAGEEQAQGETVFENDGLRAWTLGDGVVVVSFKTKLNTVGPQVLSGIRDSIQAAAAGYKAVVLWQWEEPFSAGADLNSMMPAFESGDWDSIEAVVKSFQDTSMAIKYAPVPVVAAVRGLALGGGCEFVMHSHRVVAALESYIGLVEVGVGLLPAGGGCKELALRAAHEAKGGDLLAALRNYFQNVAMANVAKSAEEARELGYLRPADVVVLNSYEVLHVARCEALALAEHWRPLLPAQPFPVAGRSGKATIQALLLNMRAGGYISDYDATLSGLVAEVMTGGDVEAGTLVDEQWILELERKHFMWLLRQEQTQARIGYMLSTGKPLRN